MSLTSPKKLAMFPLIQLPRKSEASFNSSEELKTWLNQFPLIQLPRKSEVDAPNLISCRVDKVSINSTSEEVRSVADNSSNGETRIVSINSTSEEVRRK